MIKFECPNCGRTLQYAPNMAGRRVQCTGCGNDVQIPQPDVPQAGPFAPEKTPGERLLQALMELIKQQRIANQQLQEIRSHTFWLLVLLFLAAVLTVLGVCAGVLSLGA